MLNYENKFAQHALAADLAFGLVSLLVCSLMLPVYTGALSCTAGQAAEAQAVGQKMGSVL
jgi:hypothetical protein